MSKNDRPAPSLAQAKAQLIAVLSKAASIMYSLPQAERKQLFRSQISRAMRTGVYALMPGLLIRKYVEGVNDDLLERALYHAKEARKLKSELKTLEEAKKNRDRKSDPFIAARDQEIVRLRDEGNRTFGDVARRINTWLKEQLRRELHPDEKMNYRSVQAAYRRATRDVNQQEE